jgi:hypothetical protein
MIVTGGCPALYSLILLNFAHRRSISLQKRVGQRAFARRGCGICVGATSLRCRQGWGRWLTPVRNGRVARALLPNSFELRAQAEHITAEVSWAERVYRTWCGLVVLNLRGCHILASLARVGPLVLVFSDAEGIKATMRARASAFHHAQVLPSAAATT